MKKAWTGSILIAALVLGAMVAASAVWASPAAAQTVPTPAVSDDDVNRVAKGLYCPVCENIPLDVCPTAACEQWRGVIRAKLAAGESDAAIKEYFVQAYGDRVLAEPPRTGLNWLAYILPPVVILISTVLLVRMLRRMRRAAPSQAAAQEGAGQTAPGQKPVDDYQARIEADLKRRDQ